MQHQVEAGKRPALRGVTLSEPETLLDRRGSVGVRQREEAHEYRYGG